MQRALRKSKEPYGALSVNLLKIWPKVVYTLMLINTKIGVLVCKRFMNNRLGICL